MLLVGSKTTTPKDHAKLLSIRRKIVTEGCGETVLILSAQEHNLLRVDSIVNSRVNSTMC
jgi:hypothetical protein